MNNYPEQIEQVNVTLANLNLEIAALRDVISNREAVLSLDVLTAKDEKDKPLYSNETARSAAFTLSRRDDIELQTLTAELRTHEHRRAELLANLERLRGEFKLRLLDRQEEISRAREAAII